MYNLQSSHLAGPTGCKLFNPYFTQIAKFHSKSLSESESLPVSGQAVSRREHKVLADQAATAFVVDPMVLIAEAQSSLPK